MHHRVLVLVVAGHVDNHESVENDLEDHGSMVEDRDGNDVDEENYGGGGGDDVAGHDGGNDLAVVRVYSGR
ncbi:hypothetical protein WICPIJ_000310 [Wickerhamomyces pijperi]|uniref:Uncharacterized protein n=1 Tax=Wickerhamomyces pijperi TaxID=599730 RepID=A0A9P8QGS3_WICPI|nr:hypothetical protein WICPIJ_000310 [Wickerhamomyces pijperi]